jgi:SAM-dependent methyltransferase
MLDLAGLGPGMRVLDLATGRGEPALRAAKRVGHTGVVVGVELDSALVEMAREHARAAGLANLDLRVGDAERLDDLDPHSFDVVTVRWALMYMTSPVAALTHAHRALRPGGALVAAFWAEPDRVPYFTLPRRLLERYRAMPETDFEAPGTFRHSKLAAIVRDLEAADLALDHVEEMEIPVFESEAVADVVAWVRALGLARLVADLPEHDRRAWQDDLTRELEGRRSNGVIQLGGVTRIVCARPVSSQRGAVRASTLQRS